MTSHVYKYEVCGKKLKTVTIVIKIVVPGSQGSGRHIDQEVFLKKDTVSKHLPC